MNELGAFGEPRVFGDVVQTSEIAFVWGTAEQTSVAKYTVISFLRLFLLYVAYIPRNYNCNPYHTYTNTISIIMAIFQVNPADPVHHGLLSSPALEEKL